MRAEQLNERFLNAIKGQDKSEQIRQKHKMEVWQILQRTYASIGGIKGNGFGSPEDMVAMIPFWKVATRNGEAKAVAMYKDKGGRKLVASGTDGTPEGKALALDIMKNDMERAYGEKSKASLGSVMKTFPWEILQQITHTPEEAQRILGDEITPINQVPEQDWPEDARIAISKYPQLVDYGYLHEIGGVEGAQAGEILFKVMFGTPGNKIR